MAEDKRIQKKKELQTDALRPADEHLRERVGSIFFVNYEVMA